jgi:hypothetical protein
MVFDFEIKTPEIESVLEKEIDEILDDTVQKLADNAPGEMQKVMMLSVPAGNDYKGGKRSAKGQPPAIDTRELLTSLQGRVSAKHTVEISMAEHAFYLDPIFEGEGGGYLDRPFIEDSITKAVERI